MGVIVHTRKISRYIEGKYYERSEKRKFGI